VLDAMRIGMASSNRRMDDLKAYVASKKDYLVVETPVQWA
jgi:hypothetical protein